MTGDRYFSERVTTNKKRIEQSSISYAMGRVGCVTGCRPTILYFWNILTLTRKGWKQKKQLEVRVVEVRSTKWLLGLIPKGCIKTYEIVTQAITNNGKRTVLVVDYFTPIHLIRRSKTDTVSNTKYMYTIIITMFKNVPALPAWP